MAKKNTASTISVKQNPPANLNKHPFYGLQLDDEQIVFRDSIYSKDFDIVFCESPAGTGKTLVSVATAMLMCEYGMYDGIVYVVAPTQEEKIGFLPGTAEEKVAHYCDPLYDALYKLGYEPSRVIASGENMDCVKTGEALVQCRSHLYMRGINMANKVVIIEEAQNMYFDELKRVLTRCHDSCKVVVIGNAIQCDIYKHPERSGFVPYLNRFQTEERCNVCELKTNHRGWISRVADSFYS